MTNRLSMMAVSGGLCLGFLTVEVIKQLVTYYIRYHNHDKYPVDAGLLVAITELVKMIACLGMMVYQQGFYIVHGSKLFAVPAILYMINNNLFLYALNYTTPPVWTLLIQTRIILTALVYRFIMGRRISTPKWWSLIGLTAGIVIAQLPQGQVGASLSLTAILLALLASAISVSNSVYVEHLLKSAPGSFMEQQVQLYAYGFVASVAWWLVTLQSSMNFSVLESVQRAFHDLVSQESRVILALIWLTILISGIGGLFVAAIMKRLDNLVKIFVGAIATICIGLFADMLFPDKFNLSLQFFVGNFVVLLSTVAYSTYE
eukprot:m.473397 g.473397  ORF g.473397 m.473397 type:complete len:317 (+) comp57121_c0_seq2:180-1130(+)